MKRVVVFQGLGVAEPEWDLPDGVWQRGKPRPAEEAAIWYRTKNIADSTMFPPTNPTPMTNCRMCPPGDTSFDCCTSSVNMPLYTDWGMEAYASAYKPWDHSAWKFQTPPTTPDMVALAMHQSLRQAKLEMAYTGAIATPPPDPAFQLSGYLSGLGTGQGQTHLLGLRGGQGQTHLLGLGFKNRYSPFGRLGHGDCGCNKSPGARLQGVFTEEDGSLNMTGKVAIGAGVVATAGVLYFMLRKKKR
jgi:hypothetical protein